MAAITVSAGYLHVLLPGMMSCDGVGAHVPSAEVGADVFTRQLQGAAETEASGSECVPRPKGYHSITH